MENSETLIKLASLIDKLEANNFTKEADILHQHFIRLAEELDDIPEKATDVKDVAQKAGTLINVGRGLSNIGKFLKTKPGSWMGFGLVNSLLNMGADYAVDFYENSQGPYQLFKNHFPDIQKIIVKINSLIDNSEIKQATSELENMLDTFIDHMEETKSNLKTAHNIKIRTVYNNKNTKLAIRGEFESEAPKYLRDLIQGGALGAGAGALFGGVGAVPGMIAGALGKLGGRAIEDIWYGQISDTGKAYFQAKDLKEKVERLASSIESLDADIANKMNLLADKILDKTEEINVNNPNKTYLEKLLNKYEKKVKKVTKPIVDIAKGAAGLASEALSTSEKPSSPRLERDYFI